MGRRVISVFLRLWPVEVRLRRLAQEGRSPNGPFAVVDYNRQSQVIVAACGRAAVAGIGPGMTLAHARAICSEPIEVAQANPVDDARKLDELAGWALRFSPLVSPDQPNGLWIDATGTDHLFGGEEAMLQKIVHRLHVGGFTAQASIADTPGAAWAFSRYANGGVVPKSETRKALLHLPVAALRLKAAVVDDLKRVGIKTIENLLCLPRKTIPHRFSKDVLTRLDQALGLLPEPISPMLPTECISENMKFAEPISTREDLERAATALCERLCNQLELASEGATRVDLVFHRVDNSIQAIRIVAVATRDPKHLARMFVERLEKVDPGFGIEVMTLIANLTELLQAKQVDVLDDKNSDQHDLTILVDRLVNAHGQASLYKASATQSDVPERGVKRVPTTAKAEGGWPKAAHRPIRLFAPPEPIEVTAMLPDHPPVLFRWRSKVHKIRRAEAAERIRDEWWLSHKELGEARDYFKVEDDEGKRYWIYRDNRPTPKGMYHWYLHGVFA